MTRPVLEVVDEEVPIMELAPPQLMPVLEMQAPEPGVAMAVVVPGPEGPQGPQGNQGPAGPAYSGTAFFYGEGPPGVIQGAKVGDQYIDWLTGDVYKLN